MGGSLFFFVESKSFEFFVEEEDCYLCWKTLSPLNPLVTARIVRDGETVFIPQLGYNAHGYFLMFLEFLCGR